SLRCGSKSLSEPMMGLQQTGAPAHLILTKTPPAGAENVQGGQMKHLAWAVALIVISFTAKGVFATTATPTPPSPSSTPRKTSTPTNTPPAPTPSPPPTYADTPFPSPTQTCFFPTPFQRSVSFGIEPKYPVVGDAVEVTASLDTGPSSSPAYWH